MIEMTEAEFQIRLNEAAAAGATEALKRLGLDDDHALEDIHDLRDILQSYRTAKVTALKALVRTLTSNITNLIFMGLLIALAMKAGIHFGGKP